MSLNRILALAAAIAAVAAAVGVGVIALAITLYAAVKPALGEAGAAAVVALACAVLAALVAALALRRVIPKGVKGAAAASEPASPMERVIALARQHPILAAGGAAAGLFLLARNPAILGAAMTALLSGVPRKPGR